MKDSKLVEEARLALRDFRLTKLQAEKLLEDTGRQHPAS